MHCHQFADVDALPHETNEEKVQQLRKGMEMHPEAKPYFLRQLSWHYEEVRRHDLAIACHYERVGCYEGKDVLEQDDMHHLGEAYHAISLEYKKKGDRERELYYLLKNLESAEDKQQVLATIARYYIEGKEWENAEEYYKLILEAPAKYGPHYNNGHFDEAYYYSSLADMQVKKKDYKKAIAYHEKCLELNDARNNTHGHVYWSIATVYGHFDKVKQLEYWHKAIAAYEASAKEAEEGEQDIIGNGYNQTSMRLSGYYSCLKDLYGNVGNQKKVNHFIKKTGELLKKQAEDPSGNSKEYHEEVLADNLVEQGKFKEALKIYEKLLKEEQCEENYPSHYNKIAKAYQAKGDTKNAVKYYLKMVEADQYDGEPILELAIIYFVDKKLDLARPYLERYIELCPDENARAYSSLALCLNEKEETQLYISYFKKAIEVNDGEDEELDAVIYCGIGKTYWRVLKDADNAIDCFRKMMNCNPSDALKGDAAMNVMLMSFDPYASNLAMEFMSETTPKPVALDYRPKLTLDEIKALPYYYKNLPEETLASATFHRNLQKEFREDLMNNPIYKEYFSKYDPFTVEDFCYGYAKHKLHLVTMGKYYAQDTNETSSEYLERVDAEEVFEMILQKKLFNMQILWRAGNITIPEIEIGYDFELWSEKIWDCPFLEQVTSAEVKLMQQFLLDDNYSDSTPWFLHGWQSYKELMQVNEEGDRELLPEWYQFYDGRMGTGAMLSLPDVRGEKEAFYTEVYWEWKRQQPRDAPPPPSTEPPFLQTLHAAEWTYIEFIKMFENDYINQIQQGMVDEKKHPDEDFDISDIWEAINAIRDSPTPVYFDSNLPWNEAILKAAHKMKNTRIAERLDGVYEDYLIKRELLGVLNDPGPKRGRQPHSPYKDKNREDVLERILKGRELNKEPRDLNF